MHQRALHPAVLSPAELLTQCDVTHTRGSGPGGQHRNKVQTAIVLTHRPTGITARASERRSQDENLQRAVFRLRITLAIECRCGWEAASELLQSRMTGGRLGVNERHADFPAILAELLDALAAHGWDSAEAAQSIGITHTQLVRFLKREPRALERLNAERAGLGLAPRL